MNEINITASTPDINGKSSAVAMPASMADALADCTLRCVRQFLKQPEGRSMLDSKIAQLKAQNIL